MKILFFTRYTSLAASTRYRFSQYVNSFERNGYECTLKPLLPDAYLKSFNEGTSFSNFQLIKCYLIRAWDVLSISGYDLVYIQYELLPYTPPWLIYWLKWRNISFVVDYDDAIFHNYDTHPSWIIRILFRNKIKIIAKAANHIITGSPYLTEYFKKYQPNTTEIPTSIDLELYPPLEYVNFGQTFVIGWIGSKSTSVHLLSIIDTLDRFTKKYNAEVHLIGFDKNLAHRLPSDCFRIIDWQLNQDFNLLKPAVVGIMPLINGHFEQGKCGFKLIQYMASSKPFIASPFEANLKIDRNHQNLFATTPEEWFKALESVYHNQAFYCSIGEKGRKVVQQYYCVQSNFYRYLEVFQQVVG